MRRMSTAFLLIVTWVDLLVYNMAMIRALAIIVGMLFLVACGTEATPVVLVTTSPTPTIVRTPTPTILPMPTPLAEQEGSAKIKQYSQPPQLTIQADSRYVATIHTNHGDMVIELFPKEAPITVNNFVFLSRDGYYDGVIFHRVIQGFMIQGGDPTGTGGGGPGYKFEDEFVPTLVFDQPGYLAMANSGPRTNGSQFFITVVPTPHLNGAHTIFGRVIQGQDVADAISVVPANSSSKPLQDVVIESIEIEETATGG